MSDTPSPASPPRPAPSERGRDFARQAAGRRAGIAAEFYGFLKDNKKWWLAPILVAILGLGALVVFGGGAAGPFIYALF